MATSCLPDLSRHSRKARVIYLIKKEAEEEKDLECVSTKEEDESVGRVIGPTLEISARSHLV